jgi:hypothetical protein
MVKHITSNTPAPSKLPPESELTCLHSPDVANLLERAKSLLQEQCPEQALGLLDSTRLKSPWLINAKGVCLLRLGKAEQAVELFKGLAGASGVYILKFDAPITFKTNYATALLAANDLKRCLHVLHEIGKEDNPTVTQLRSAIQQWKRSLSLWQKIGWYLGEYPQRPVTLNFLLGELE